VLEYQSDLNQSIVKLKEIVSSCNDKSIGILSFDSKDLDVYKNEFKDNQFVRVLTIAEAQGVEFDIVCIVGINKDMFLLNIPAEFVDERKKIYKDKMYIALTRAILEMHVFGECSLKEVL
jgi:superfamily I DNA/RNA helicase